MPSPLSTISKIFNIYKEFHTGLFQMKKKYDKQQKQAQNRAKESEALEDVRKKISKL